LEPQVGTYPAPKILVQRRVRGREPVLKKRKKIDRQVGLTSRATNQREKGTKRDGIRELCSIRLPKMECIWNTWWGQGKAARKRQSRCRRTIRTIAQ